jgi:hypothetical protein
MNDGMLWKSLRKRGEMMEKQERMTRNAIKRTRVGINISAELADVLQAEQERWRNAERSHVASELYQAH